MCSSNSKFRHRQPNDTTSQPNLFDISGRRVLQPATSNRNSPLPEPPRPLKTTLPLPKSISTSKPNQPPASCTTPKSVIPVKKAKNGTVYDRNSIETNTDSSPRSPPGSIAAARREQVAVMQVQRKMKIAHYGRSKSYSFDRNCVTSAIVVKQKRCSFITPNSDAIYVAYHDDEWGVPVYDDKMLFELLVLTGAQVGSDWTSVLKKRQQFREAFSGFDADIVSKYSEKMIQSLSSKYGIEVSFVRGIVDNSKSISEINKTFGSFNNYIWRFVNHKPIVSQYKSSHKMPVKTSKAEAISKDMVRRGFRQVGPTVIYSFMQAAGLTNDHLITCPRHHQCVTLASPTTPTPPSSVK
ncbi:putative DNA-3-methyladenine glycosylase I [Helianthus debilis subsp. tardiflorus]